MANRPSGLAVVQPHGRQHGPGRHSLLLPGLAGIAAGQDMAPIAYRNINAVHMDGVEEQGAVGEGRDLRRLGFEALHRGCGHRDNRQAQAGGHARILS